MPEHISARKRPRQESASNAASRAHLVPAGSVESVSSGGKKHSYERLSPEAKVLIEQWQKEYNQVRPHSSLSCRSPASEVMIPVTLTE